LCTARSRRENKKGRFLKIADTSLDEGKKKTWSGNRFEENTTPINKRGARNRFNKTGLKKEGGDISKLTILLNEDERARRRKELGGRAHGHPSSSLKRGEKAERRETPTKQKNPKKKKQKKTETKVEAGKKKNHGGGGGVTGSCRRIIQQEVIRRKVAPDSYRRAVGKDEGFVQRGRISIQKKA